MARRKINLEKLLTQFSWRKILGHIISWNPFVGIVIVVVVLVFYGLLSIYGEKVKEYVVSKTWDPVLGTDTSVHESVEREQSMESSNGIERIIGVIASEDKYKNRCSGALFDIVEDLSVVGGERFEFPDASDNHLVSPPKTGGYQGSFKTDWGCRLPSIATISAFPVSGPSLGLFMEWENVYRIMVGDGDRLYVKLQSNVEGYRSDWPTIFREKLSQPIEDGKELIVIVRAKEDEGSIIIEVEVYHSGQNKPDVFISEPIRSGPNLNVMKERPFRIGVNDWEFRGEGVFMRLEGFSILEKKW